MSADILNNEQVSYFGSILKVNKRIEFMIELGFNVRKGTLRNARPAKIQIRLRKCAVWAESSLGAFWIA